MTLQANGKVGPDYVIDTTVQPFPGAGDSSAPNGAAVNRPSSSPQPAAPLSTGSSLPAGPNTAAATIGSMGPQI